MPEINIIETSLHKIDISKQKVGKRININSDSNFTEYVKDLVDDMYKENSRHKSFQFESYVSEVAGQVAKVNEDTWRKISRVVAKRLHRSEIAKQKQMGKFQELRRGSLVQLLVNIDTQKTIIFTKVDLDSYLDEKELKKKNGLPVKKRTQKTAIISFNGDDTISSILLSDSNKTISEYWWKDFLEVRELNSSESNTTKAFTAIDKVLQTKLKKDYKLDYWTLRDAVLSYFRTNDSFTLDSMVEVVFEDYRPDNPNLDINEVKDEVITLPKREKGGFDSQFRITHSAIKARMINKKIPLAKNLELNINGDLKDLRKLIDTGKSNDGREYVRIFSKNGYDEFQRYLDSE